MAWSALALSTGFAVFGFMASRKHELPMVSPPRCWGYPPSIPLNLIHPIEYYTKSSEIPLKSHELPNSCSAIPGYTRLYQAIPGCTRLYQAPPENIIPSGPSRATGATWFTRCLSTASLGWGFTQGFPEMVTVFIHPNRHTTLKDCTIHVGFLGQTSCGKLRLQTS